jgi:two-component system OmpR family response regulator
MEARPIQLVAPSRQGSARARILKIEQVQVCCGLPARACVCQSALNRFRGTASKTDSRTGSGYRVSAAANGAAMMQTMAAARIDLVVLDIMMPGEDGLSICRRLRAAGTMPVIMLTSKTEEIDRIVGLEIGADDYLPKPFITCELLARVRAVLRRTAMAPAASPSGSKRIVEFAGWRLNATRRQLHSPVNALVDLRTAEFDLLLALVERRDHVLTRDQLLDIARGRAASACDRSIDVHISRLRHRIEADPKIPS